VKIEKTLHVKKTEMDNTMPDTFRVRTAEVITERPKIRQSEKLLKNKSPLFHIIKIHRYTQGAFASVNAGY
jgi:hypothetical protein